MTTPTPEQILASPSASNWVKDALRTALQRDCVDAANDAEVLARVLAARCSGDWWPLSLYCRTRGINLVDTVADVGRKKDL